MATHGPRLEFAVGAFLLLALASLLVLALASTNGKFGFGHDTYPLKARFTNLGQLRQSAPVKIGGVAIGSVADIQLDPVKLDAVVTLDIDNRYNDLPSDTSAGILSNGLLGESYIGLQPGGALEPLKPGEEIAYTTPAVDLIQMVGKYIFGGGGGDKDADASTDSTSTDSSGDVPATDVPATTDSPTTDTPTTTPPSPTE